MAQMDRRNFVKTIGFGGAVAAAVGIGRPAPAQEAQKAQTARDPANMTPLEAHHVPKIETANAAPKAGEPLQVSVVIDHPMAAEHHIAYIEVFMDDRKIAAFTLTPDVMKPALTVTLTPKKSFELTVQDMCNLHGLWENRRKIEVA